MMKRKGLHTLSITSLVCTISLAMCGCDESNKYPKNNREFPEPWQILDSGKPPEKFARFEVLKQGKGTTVEAGDLVQVHSTFWSPRQSVWSEGGDWWIWIGFRSAKETAFFGIEPDVARVLVGLQLGTSLRFLEGKEVRKFIQGVSSVDRSGQLRLYPNPFGDHEYYSWRKNTRETLRLSELSESGHFSVLEITRVCKGPLQYRTVRVFDDSPVKVCRGFDCYVSNEPREAWIDEAKIEATCQDGRKVKFEYGPVDSRNGKDEKSQVRGYFDEWFKNAWRKIPRGVQFEGNHPPVAKADKFTIPGNTATRIDILANDTDPDHDRLTARVIRPPHNGTLSANAEGTYTYTATNECRGDNFTYRASDGLVESDDVSVNISITRDKPADPNLLSKC